VSPSEIAECGGAIGMGYSLEDAIGEANDVAGSIKGEGLSYDSGALRKAMECIRNGNKLGLTWGVFIGANYGDEVSDRA
jgi:hypothetical protein